MTEDVRLCISGLRLQYFEEDAEEEDISVIVSGKYENVGGVHTITYAEVMEDANDIINNTIYITPHSMEIRKEGATVSRMHFTREKNVVDTTYSTPFGDVFMRLSTHAFQMKEEKDRITVDVDYSLSIENAMMSNSKIKLDICSKNMSNLEL